MNTIIDFFGSIAPYLLFIPLGYWLTKKKAVPKSWLTIPLIYVMMPVLVIHHFLEADPIKLAILPPISFAIAILMLLPAHWANKTFAKDYDPNLVKSVFSFFNVAFFGIPIVTALFGPQAITVLICIYIGTALYGDIFGYYLMARSKYSVKEAIGKVFQAPFVYAFSVALTLKLLDVELPGPVESVADVFSILVSAGGMYIIGSNVSDLNFNNIDWKFANKTMGLRLLAALVFTAVFILAEFFILDLLDVDARKMLVLLPLFPVAANVTVFASFFGSEEENSGVLVLLTLGVSLILVPLVAMWF
jgi:malate permease and related proteins